MNKTWVGVCMIVVLAVVAIGYYSIASTSLFYSHPPVSESDEDVGIPVHIELTLISAPALGQSAELLANISSVRDYSNTIVNINLPEGFELISGDLSWEGNLTKDQVLQLKVIIKAVKNGEWTIEGSVKSVVSEDSWWVDKDTIYISIDNSKTSVNSIKPAESQSNSQIFFPLNSSMSNTSDFVQSALLSTPSSCPGTGYIKVYGYEYYDKNGNWEPIRHAKIELYDSDLPWDVLLATTSTQADGYFEFPTVSNDDGYLGGGMDVFVKVYTDTEAVKITADGSNAYYFHSTVQPNVADGCVDHGSWGVGSSISNYKSYWIYDDVLNAFQFLASYGHTSFKSIVKWSNTSTDGTYYRRGEWIHLVSRQLSSVG